MFTSKRSTHNPILSPRTDHAFESWATFNAQPLKVGKSVHILYRAQSLPERFENENFSLSTIGKAVSTDGVHFKNREQFIEPTEMWERYGCEDPRVTYIDGKYFIFYTALSVFPFRAEGIKVGLAISKDLKKIDEKHLVTPFNAKAMSLFSEKIKGKYVAILTANTDRVPSHIALAKFNTVSEMWSESYWNKWYKDLDSHTLSIPKGENEHLEVGAAPLKTKYGWLLVCCRVQNYFSDQKVFGIEALLLDLKNPEKIIAQTRGPIIVPEESYEKYGIVPHTIFPSGVLLEKDTLSIYYGATDTSVAVAKVSLSLLLESMVHPEKMDLVRPDKKPILKPTKNKWEVRAVFNPAAIDLGGSVHILYRAMSLDNTSVVGYARSKNGTVVDERLKTPVYSPRAPFEDKRVPNGNSGCEDPRLTLIGDTVYMYYTAYNGINPPAIAETHISKKDFLKRNWNWSYPVVVTKDGVDDKDGCLHPEKVKGKYFLFHRVNNMICGDYGSTPQFAERNNFKDIPILSPRKGMWDSKKVGISVPPIKTKKGWLLLYHGVSDNGIYRVGAVMLDLKDPTQVLSRTTDYIFEPREDYEKNGQIHNVVFPCGAVLRKDKIFVYYGGADNVVDVATVSLKKVLQALG